MSTTTIQPIDALAGVPQYGAQNERQGFAALMGGGSGRQLGARPGLRLGTPSNLITVTSTTWTAGIEFAAILDPAFSTTQGPYRYAYSPLPSADSGSITPADPTYPRKDIIVIRVDDASAGDPSGARQAPLVYRAGTAVSMTPTAPSLNAREFLVGTITVPQVGGGSPTFTLNPQFFVAAGAPQPLFSQADQDAFTPYDGAIIRRMDLPGRPFSTWSASTSTWGPLADAQGIQPGRVKVTANGAGLTTLAVQNNIGSFAFRGGRKYKIVWQGGHALSVNTDYFNLAIQTCSTADAAGAITGLTTIQARSYTANSAGAGESFYVEAIYEPPSDVTLQVKFTVARALGSGTWTLQASAGAPAWCYIEDQGAAY